LPYHDATQSGPLLISLSFNCPVIAADVGGLPEYLSEGKNGLLFKKDSCSDLADKIVHLLTDEVRLRDMQSNSRSLLIDRFSPSTIATELLSVLENI
jgi:glycosyltransferase involved in cell wall biosynthesis